MFPGVVNDMGDLAYGEHSSTGTGSGSRHRVTVRPARLRVPSEVFDHTSVLKLVEQKWNLPALTGRDAAASVPIGALDLTAPQAFLTPPALHEPALKWGSW